MTPPQLVEEIQQHEARRRAIADVNRLLAERELTGRLLRLTIETELRQGGMAVTPAERQAKTDARYLKHERERIQLEFDRDVSLAEAEAQLLGIRLHLAELHGRD
jgi:hypothetical protein